MIDFRYHLVSLVSVFLALAVGIVLGAGPLEGKLGDQLNIQVKQLAAEKEELRTKLAVAEGAVDHRDSFLEEISPSLARQQLGGESVLIVALPGTAADVAAPLTKTLRQAGARIVGRVDVTEAWTDPTRSADREKALRQLRPFVAATASTPTAPGAAAVATPASPPPPVPTITGATTDSLALASLLTRATVTANLAEAATRDAAADTIIDGLVKSGLVGVEEKLAGRATEVVVLAAGVPAQDGSEPTGTKAGTQDPLTQWSALVAGLDARSGGTVVVGPASCATEGGLIASLRSRETLAGTVSTVDTGSTPMGDLSVVYALREQSLGGAGSYGFVGKVKAPVPVLTEVNRS
jgi:hypothetical protein